MNKDMIELIWHSLSIEFKNKVDANVLLVGTGFHEQCCYVSTSERSNDDAMKN